MILTLVGMVLYLFFYRKAVNFTERVRDEFVQFNEYTHGLVFGIKELKLNRARRRWFTRRDRTVIEARGGIHTSNASGS